MIDEKRARKFCKEDISKIKNYDKAIADTTQVWDCHHMTETWWNCSRKELIENECYYNRKACELIFLTKAEHTRLHNKGRTFSEETRKKMSEAKKGMHHSYETRRKMSESHKNMSDETRKKLSEATKGENNPMYGRTGEKSSFFGKRHTDETRKKMSDAAKRRWAKKRGEV